MHISYKPLWHTLVERNMRKEDLRLAAGLTTNMIALTWGEARTSAWKRWFVSAKP